VELPCPPRTFNIFTFNLKKLIAVYFVVTVGEKLAIYLNYSMLTLVQAV
jgi:hypothetical protein